MIKTPRPTMVKTPRPTKLKTPKPTMVKTPRPTKNKTPKPTRPEKTPHPTKLKTPKPTRPERYPHPTRMKTPRPTKLKTPKPVRVKTPRPTVWSPPKTPKPTNPPKTPRPTAIYIRTPKPTNPPKIKTPKPTKPPKTPRPTRSYIQPTPEPTMGGGWGPVAPEPEPTDGKEEESKPTPLVGCAENMLKKTCNMDAGGCVWMSGYPPLAFSEDSDYQLLDAEESFFAVNGSVIDMVQDMDSNMLMLFGVIVAATLLYAIKECALKKKRKKVVADVNAQRAYGSFVET